MWTAALLCLLALVAPPVCAQTQRGHGHSSRPSAAPPDVDCAVRKLASAYGAQLVPEAKDVIDSGLELGAMCGEPTPQVREGPSPLARGRHVVGSHAAEIVVDASGSGSDVDGDGSATAPLASVPAALRLSRLLAPAPGACKKTIALKSGTHYLNETMQLGPQDSGLCLVGAAGEHATLSGGMELTLTWTKLSGGGGVYVADLPAGSPVFDQLFVDGRREVRARYPNGDPETTGLHTMDTGYISEGSWSSKRTPTPAKKESIVALISPKSMRHAPSFPIFSMGFDGLCERYAKNRSKWGGTPRPTEVSCSDKSMTGANYSQPCKRFNWAKPTTGVVHAYHGGHWGGWMFKVDGLEAQTVQLDPWGGQQEARGNSKGAEWYVENIREELDAPREWFADFQAKKLYYYPNATAPPAKVVVPRLATLISIDGGSPSKDGKPRPTSAVVSGIQMRGFTLTHSLTTFLAEYEVPSGGDWSMHRGGALFATGASELSIEGVHFTRLGGNAVMLSEYVRDSSFHNCEFSWVGDSGIGQMGSVKFDRTSNRSPESLDLMDATDGEHPEGTTVQSCVFREIGVYGKQVSAFASALAFKTTINGSVFFNGPRAGINWNDGMGGDNSVTQNLMFNWVRETSDHGNFNSWDRLPFVTTSTGVASTDVLPTSMTSNFVISNYASTWPLDHDDGSCYYHDTRNFLVWAGAKNFLGQYKVSADNVYVHADANGMSVCAVDDSPWGGKHVLSSSGSYPSNADIFRNNTCITATGVMYHYSRCDPENIPDLTDLSSDNTFVSPNTPSFMCGSTNFTLGSYQAAGYEIGSSHESDMPTAGEIAKMGAALLGIHE